MAAAVIAREQRKCKRCGTGGRCRPGLYDRTTGLRQSFRSAALNLPSTGAWLMWYASFGGGFLLEDVTIP